MKITKQTSKDQMWKDEAGTAIPYNRTTAYERSAETSLHSLAVHADKINVTLTEFKNKVRKEAERLYELFVKENGQLGKGKGGATFYNFDRSIKVEVAVNDQIAFDENTIALAKEKLDELMNEGLAGVNDFIHAIAMDAFQTTSGRLDTKKIFGLRKYANRIKDAKQKAEYMEAMALIDKSVRRPSTREYFRVWVRDEAGEYQNIQLNFASI